MVAGKCPRCCSDRGGGVPQQCVREALGVLMSVLGPNVSRCVHWALMCAGGHCGDRCSAWLWWPSYPLV